jgi:hypothetical protein
MARIDRIYTHIGKVEHGTTFHNGKESRQLEKSLGPSREGEAHNLLRLCELELRVDHVVPVLPT